MADETRDLSAIRILYPNFKTVQTGVSSTIFTLSAELRAMGADLSVVGVQPPGEDTARSTGRRGKPAFTVWHSRRNIEMLAGLLLRLVRPGMAVIFTSAGQRKHSKYTDFLMSKVDAIVATSGISAGFVDRETTIIPHGIDTTRFSPADRHALKQSLGLDPDAHYAGVFGAVRSSKGTDLFIDAMIEVLRDRPNWKAIQVGNVVPSQQEFDTELRRRVAAASLSDRIVFLGRVEDARDYVRAVDICVAPSRNEGFGLTPLEAMASGVPVVASRAGSYAETVVDGVTGLLAETGSASSLSQSLARLMDDPDLRITMAQAGRQHVISNFSVRREAEALLDLYFALKAKSGRA